MTIEDLISAIKESIQNDLGFPAFVLPQKAVNNTAHIALIYQDCRPNGENSIKLVFTAEYATNGTHIKWLENTISLQRKLFTVEDSFMLLNIGTAEMKNVLRAYWIRLGPPRWVYPNESESSMPAELMLQYRIEIDIPSNLLED